MSTKTGDVSGVARRKHKQKITRRRPKPSGQQVRADQVATSTEHDLNALLELRAAALAQSAAYAVALLQAAASGEPLEHLHALQLLADNQRRLADFFGARIAGVTP